MTTQITSLSLTEKQQLQTNQVQRLGLFIVFLICGLVVLFLGSNFYKIFPTNQNLTYNLTISAVFLAAALSFKYGKRMNIYWHLTFAFFIASIVYPITSLTAGWKSEMLSRLGLVAGITSQGTAVDKLFQMVLTVIPILVLIKLSGADLASIYLKRGDLKMGLSFGALVWFNFATSAFLFFATRFTIVDRFVAAVIWGLVFSFANGFLEELWFRSIFLKRLQPFLGVSGAVLLTSIVFSVIHAGSTYLTPIALPFMLANTFTLGLACGYLTMKSDSIWGATLIHAAADFFLFIAMLSNA
jgi:membrane protease YdiL (CAAX protease family)